jgi:hypothetical protein
MAGFNSILLHLAQDQPEQGPEQEVNAGIGAEN